MLAKLLDVEKPSDDYGTRGGSVDVEPESHRDASVAPTKEPTLNFFYCSC
jgi:hypothetical protein